MSRGRHLQSRWGRQMVKGKKGRWKKKRNCSQRVYHRRGACVGRWSVRWGATQWWDSQGVGKYCFLKEREKKREKDLEEAQTRAVRSQEAAAIVSRSSALA